MTGTYNAIGRDGEVTQGGYSGAIVVDENYVLRIPDSIPLDSRCAAAVRGDHAVFAAAPLECRTRQRGSRSIGLGGLGHMGVKLAARDGRQGDGA